MDIATTAATAKKVIKMATKIKTIIDLDQQKRIIIKRDIVAGTFVRKVPDFRCVDFEIVSGVMTIFRTSDREPICDSVSLAPDKIWDWDIVVSSVVHDCIYRYLERIAKAWGWPIERVRELADNAFGCDMLARARTEKNAIKRAVYVATAHIYYAAVRIFGGIYHSIKKGSSVLAVLLLFTACNIPADFIPSGEQLDYIATNIITRAEYLPLPEQPAPQPSKPQPPAPVIVDAVDYSLLRWDCGGFNGAAAKHREGVIIAALAVNSRGLSYRWQSGNCEMLGAAGHTNADCIAALFCKVGDQWRGGKFDWISTSRLTRDFANINGYKGWSRSLFDSATEYAFVIVSKDGKRRSNVIKCAR